MTLHYSGNLTRDSSLKHRRDIDILRETAPKTSRFPELHGEREITSIDIRHGRADNLRRENWYSRPLLAVYRTEYRMIPSEFIGG